jgi:hypothetical protein
MSKGFYVTDRLSESNRLGGVYVWYVCCAVCNVGNLNFELNCISLPRFVTFRFTVVLQVRLIGQPIQVRYSCINSTYKPESCSSKCVY